MASPWAGESRGCSSEQDVLPSTAPWLAAPAWPALGRAQGAQHTGGMPCPGCTSTCSEQCPSAPPHPTLEGAKRARSDGEVMGQWHSKVCARHPALLTTHHLHSETLQSVSPEAFREQELVPAAALWVLARRTGSQAPLHLLKEVINPARLAGGQRCADGPGTAQSSSPRMDGKEADHFQGSAV